MFGGVRMDNVEKLTEYINQKENPELYLLLLGLIKPKSEHIQIMDKEIQVFI